MKLNSKKLKKNFPAILVFFSLGVLYAIFKIGTIGSLRTEINSEKETMKIKTKDNFELDLVYYRLPGSKKAVILAHGMTVNKDDEGIFVRAEKELQNLGFSTLRFDFRAHGKSQGDPVTDFKISGELTDLETMVDFAQKEGYEWIGLAGASFGGGVSALFAGMNPDKIDMLFLANPVLDYERAFLNPITPWAQKNFQNALERIDRDGFIKVGSHQFPIGMPLFEEMNEFNPCRELKNFSKPLLIAHGDSDTYVSYSDALECFRNLPSQNKDFVTIKGSDHGFDEEPYESEVVEKIVNFFAN